MFPENLKTGQMTFYNTSDSLPAIFMRTAGSFKGFWNKLEPEFSSKKTLKSNSHLVFQQKSFWLRISEVDLVHNCWICQCLISYVLSIVYIVQNHTFFILFFFTFWKQNHQVAKFVTKFKIIKKLRFVYMWIYHICDFIFL